MSRALAFPRPQSRSSNRDPSGRERQEGLQLLLCWRAATTRTPQVRAHAGAPILIRRSRLGRVVSCTRLHVVGTREFTCHTVLQCRSLHAFGVRNKKHHPVCVVEGPGYTHNGLDQVCIMRTWGSPTLMPVIRGASRLQAGDGGIPEPDISTATTSTMNEVIRSGVKDNESVQRTWRHDPTTSAALLLVLNLSANSGVLRDEGWVVKNKTQQGLIYKVKLHNSYILLQTESSFCFLLLRRSAALCWTA